MKLLSRLLSPAVALALGLGALAGPVAAAERSAPLRRALPPDVADGRVIVTFKADAQWRSRILQAQGGDRRTTSAVKVQALLDERAGTLGLRRGVALRSGPAVDERTQVVIAPGIDSRRLAVLLAADAEVASAVPDGRSRALRIPNDPLYAPNPVPVNGPASGQWYLKPPQAALVNGNEVLASIDAQSAWDITTGHQSVVVAVLDTGVRREHPDLAGKVLAGYDVVSQDIANDGNGPDPDPADPGDFITQGDRANPIFADCDVSDSSWHGTQVAGLIAAATNNATGMAGAGWNTRILPVRVLGKCFGYDSDIRRGMRWAAGLSVPGLPANPTPAKVINLSLGGEGACNADYQATVNEVRAAGVVVVAAAGNTAGRAVNNPANCSGVIGVVGLRHIGTKVGFSDLGPEITIAAPGGNCVNVGSGDPCLFPLLSTTNAGSTTPGAATYSTAFDISVGTSFSAPLVSATVALMRVANSSLTPDQVRDRLRATARPFPQSGAPADPDTGAIQVCHAPNSTDQLQCYCTTSTCGAGMLDARAAVASVARLQGYVDGATTASLNQAVTLGSDSTVTAPGRTIAARQWTLLTPGAGITSLDGQSTTGPTLTLTPTAAGSVTVQLKVTDSTGAEATYNHTLSVADPSAPPVATPPPSDSGGGGGAMSGLWLAALAAAVALSRPRRRR